MQETQETWVPSLGWEDPLEEEMATHSNILAWRIPRTEEPGGLQSTGSRKSRTRPSHTHTHTYAAGMSVKLLLISLFFIIILFILLSLLCLYFFEV